MKSIYIHPFLAESNLIKVIFSSNIELESEEAKLIIDHSKKITLKGKGDKKKQEIAYQLEKDLELGHSYFIEFPLLGMFPLDISNCTNFEGFDEKYFFDGELGAIYSKEKTTFRLWAPLASKVVLKVKAKNDDEYRHLAMKRAEKGVFELIVKGDLNEAEYLYDVTNNEITSESIDPYAKASTENGRSSVVLDMESLSIDKTKEHLPHYSDYVRSIIYEGNVRDLTIGRHTNIEHKGKYLGLVEENRTTDGGHPAGIDYFKMLGFTHIELLPINDFKTVDETGRRKTYNWGYDPSQYFVPEGSYSTDPKDPKARIIEVQKMVHGFHKAGIRVVMDVVFNHVYEYLTSSFEKITPNYWFRKKKDGKMANASWCGNDLASEKPMVRKMILDAAKWWIDYYGIDGFRFDLMGILDIKTVKEIAKYGKSKDPSFMTYGEGWNMGGETKAPLANMDNHGLIPDFAFFNDTFREAAKRYLGGEISAKDDFKYSLLGSCLEWSGREPKFESLNQTINYVECHDNWTYHDYLENVKGVKSLTERLNRCKLGLAAALFSFGIPFIHAGQETAQSKFGVENSYNAGDSINKFSWALLDERWDMAMLLKDLIKARKMTEILNSPSIFPIMKNIEFFGDENLVFICLSPDEGKEISLLLNPTNKNISYTFPEDRALIFTSGGSARSLNTRVTNVLIPKQSFVIVSNY